MSSSITTNEDKGNSVSPEMMGKITAIVGKYEGKVGQLIPILQDIQAEFYYLPKEVLLQLSETMGIPISRVYSVATFFKAFSLEPRGKHIIDVCLGTACHVRGAAMLLDKIERSLEIKKQLSGPESEDVATVMNNLAAVYSDIDRVEEDVRLNDESLRLRRKLFGKVHPDIAQSLNNLALIYKNQGNYDKAREYFFQAHEIWVEVFGTEHPEVAAVLRNIGGVYYSMSDYQKAEEYYLRSYEMRVKLLGEEHQKTQWAKQDLDNVRGILSGTN